MASPDPATEVPLKMLRTAIRLTETDRALLAAVPYGLRMPHESFIVGGIAT